MPKLGIPCAFVAGIVFGISWWLFIDGASHANNDKDCDCTVEVVDALPLVGVTIAFILLVWFPWDRLEGEDYMYEGGCGNVQACARIILFIVVLMSVGSCIGSGLLLGSKWAGNDKGQYTWFGVAQLLATILVFLSGVIWRVGRNMSDDTGF